MADTIVLLRIDHRNMAILLAALERQQEILADGGPVNHPLLESAFAYLLGYPDECHHPKEDAVYRKLLIRDPRFSTELMDLSQEHAKLSQQTRTLHREIAECRPGAKSPELAGKLGEFIQAYRKHMRMEEQHFFPAALEKLTADDWEEIEFALFDGPDPLFDGKTEAGYAELRSEIKRLEAELDEAPRLAEMEDVAAFNAAMQQHGDPLRLQRSDTGGYRLQRAGRTLVRIPECSESRAAWCAWFFWKALKISPP